MSLVAPPPPDVQPHQVPIPYISLVVTSRNDSHGLNIQKRMQAFVDGWFHQTAKFNLPSELIFVEWNPPADRPRLIDSLTWPHRRGPCRLRLIEVPQDLHKRYACADRLPLYQFIAKNAGIRRAKAPFVLTSNIDILFSDELMAFLAEQRLERDVIYRNDRLDVPMELPDLPMDDLIAWCRNNSIRINRANYTLDLRDGSLYAIASGFFSAWSGFLTDATIFTGKALPSLILAGGLAVRHLEGGNVALAKCIIRAAWGGLLEGLKAKRARTQVSLDRAKRAIPAHTNACGDFELMSLKNWIDIQGYPEYEGYSMHVDSLLLLCAVASGKVKERRLDQPMAHYHIEHSQGSGFTPEGERKLYEGLAKRAIPFLLWEEVESIVEQFRLKGRHAAFNDKNWGLGQFTLRETVLLED
jgi:hypothetical protein